MSRPRAAATVDAGCRRRRGLAASRDAAARRSWRPGRRPSSRTQRAAPQQSEPAPSSPPPAREENPGLINEIGKLFEKSLSILPTAEKPAGDHRGFERARQGCGKDARQPVASGQAILHGDRAHDLSGFDERRAGLQGRRRQALPEPRVTRKARASITDAAENCSAKVYLPGHKREPGDCRTENYVTRALCQ